jgi:large subunit ribosomal protein L18
MKKEERIKRIRKQRRTVRARKSLAKSEARLTVFRSNKHIYAQIIDDLKGKTLVSVSEKDIKTEGNKTLRAQEIGKAVAQKAKTKKITKVVFDRGSYKYHGRVKALADGAREGGLQF